MQYFDILTLLNKIKFSKFLKILIFLIKKELKLFQKKLIIDKNENYRLFYIF